MTPSDVVSKYLDMASTGGGNFSIQYSLVGLHPDNTWTHAGGKLNYRPAVQDDNLALPAHLGSDPVDWFFHKGNANIEGQPTFTLKLTLSLRRSLGAQQTIGTLFCPEFPAQMRSLPLTGLAATGDDAAGHAILCEDGNGAGVVLRIARVKGPA